MKFLTLTAALMVAQAAHAQSKLPVREVTVFKDGHAFVLHEGQMAATNGEVVLDELPTPVVGTFWAYLKNGTLKGVTSARRLVSTSQKAQSVRDLLKANVGAQVIILEGDKRYEATVLGVPESEKPEAPNPETAALSSVSPRSRPVDEIILLQTPEGVRVAPIDSIRNVIFKTAPKMTGASEEWKNLLRLQLPNANQTRAEVGMVYLQKGLRWIPSYRIALGNDGRAKIELQSTIVNDLVDLKDATANLVIGVPTFEFKDTPDPISLQQTFVQLGNAFNAGTRGREVFSNAIQSQVASNSYALAPTPIDAGETAANASGAGNNEDYFLFTLKNLTLNKGERMVMPLNKYDLAYQSIFTFNAPLSPPTDLYRTMNYQQQNELAANLARPNVMHKLRLTNSSNQPLTTAPALIERDGRLLSQTMMTYTATGGRSDLVLAPAVDVTARQSETETKRTPKALAARGYEYDAVEVNGKLVVTSFRNAPITLELSRLFIGTVTRVSHDGKIRKLGASDDELRSTRFPDWWNQVDYNTRGANAISSVTWTVQIPAKKSVELTYDVNYFWR